MPSPRKNGRFFSVLNILFFRISYFQDSFIRRFWYQNKAICLAKLIKFLDYPFGIIFTEYSMLNMWYILALFHLADAEDYIPRNELYIKLKRILWGLWCIVGIFFLNSARSRNFSKTSKKSLYLKFSQFSCSKHSNKKCTHIP